MGSVADEDFAIERIEGELEASAKEGGEVGVGVRNASYPSPSAQIDRASQYKASESDGSGSSFGSALGLSVPSGCIQSTKLPRRKSSVTVCM